MAYEFHYTPTGTGVISGKEVLEQTEDAINDLGNTAISGVQEALDKAEQALTNSANAVDDAQTALNTANNAEGVAIQAQTDVSNLSGTVTNIGNRVTTAEGNITNLQGRMTTAESGISGLNTRMGTAEGNITTLQSNVSTAQATANSAQQTANTARQQSYILRYSSSSVTDNSTIAYSTLDNTDNIKAGDKVIDVDGKIFSIVSVDTANQTVTVGSALIDLALDANVVHTSGNETVGGAKTFSDKLTMLSAVRGVDLSSQTVDADTLTSNASGDIKLYRCTSISGASNITNIPVQTAFILIVMQVKYTGVADSRIIQIFYDVASTSVVNTYTRIHYNGTWSNWQKDTDKFVTTDTDQSISARKIFNVTPFIYNPDPAGNTPNLFLKSAKAIKGDTSGSNSDNIRIPFTDKNDKLVNYIQFRKTSNGSSDITLYCATFDSNNQDISSGLTFFKAVDGSSVFCSISDNDVSLGNNSYKFKDVRTYLLNGLTPSSLSLPTDNASNIIDISSYITALDGSANSYQALDNGWIALTIESCSGIQANISGYWGHQVVRPSIGTVRFLMPICKNMTVGIYIFNGTLSYAKFIPCQGNV